MKFSMLKSWKTNTSQDSSFSYIFFTQRSYLENKREKIRIHNIKQNDLSALWWIQKAGTYNSCHCDKTSKSCYWNKINIRCCYFKRDDRHLQSKLLADRVSLLLLLPYSYYSGHSIWNHKWVKFWCHHKAVIMWIIKNSKIEFTGPTWDWVYYNITKFHFRFVLKYENLNCRPFFTKKNLMS